MVIRFMFFILSIGAVGGILACFWEKKGYSQAYYLFFDGY